MNKDWLILFFILKNIFLKFDIYNLFSIANLPQFLMILHGKYLIAIIKHDTLGLIKFGVLIIWNHLKFKHFLAV